MYIYLTTLCKELIEFLAKLLPELAFVYCHVQEGQSTGSSGFQGNLTWIL